VDTLIMSVSDLLEAVSNSDLTKKEHAHVRVWFRGQGDQVWLLAPGVYRPGFANGETERQRKERHLSQDFLTMSVPLRDFRSDAEAYFTQQHYRMPTRLLD